MDLDERHHEHTYLGPHLGRDCCWSQDGTVWEDDDDDDDDDDDCGSLPTISSQHIRIFLIFFPKHGNNYFLSARHG